MKNAIVLKLNCTVMPGALHCPELRPFRSSSSQQTLQGRFSTIFKFCLNELVTEIVCEISMSVLYMGGLKSTGFVGWRHHCIENQYSYQAFCNSLSLQDKSHFVQKDAYAWVLWKWQTRKHNRLQTPCGSLFYPLQWSPWDAFFLAQSSSVCFDVERGHLNLNLDPPSQVVRLACLFRICPIQIILEDAFVVAPGVFVEKCFSKNLTVSNFLVKCRFCRSNIIHIYVFWIINFVDLTLSKLYTQIATWWTGWMNLLL